MFFERFREAVARLPAGLLRPGPAADADAVEAAVRALGRPLPDDYASFLRSFDGADLFHESVVIAGVGAQSPLRLADLNPQSPAAELAFAETTAGDRFVFAEKSGAVYRVRSGSEERVLAGSDFTRWLDATVAREQILYGADGEFAPEVFEDDGEEIQPRIALRQAERALRVDAGSAEAHCDRGIALRRVGRLAEAADAFERAAELDAGNPWLWFDLGRAALEHDPRRAAEAFRRAAEAEGARRARACSPGPLTPPPSRTTMPLPPPRAQRRSRGSPGCSRTCVAPSRPPSRNRTPRRRSRRRCSSRRSPPRRPCAVGCRWRKNLPTRDLAAAPVG